MQPGCMVGAITTSYIFLEPLFSSSLCFGGSPFVLTESKSLLACGHKSLRRDEEVVGAYDDRSIPFNIVHVTMFLFPLLRLLGIPLNGGTQGTLVTQIEIY
jgi:hypothetical protein